MYLIALYGESRLKIAENLLFLKTIYDILFSGYEDLMTGVWSARPTQQ
jgi:hypothetical protein